MRHIILPICLLILLPDGIKAQVSIAKDSLSKGSKTFEIWYAGCLTRVNTNYVLFNKGANTYTLAKAHYTPNVAGGFTWGWLDKAQVFSLNVGLSLITASADLTTQTGQSLRYSEGLIQIPVVCGIRYPIRYAPVKNGFKRWVELRAGTFFEVPVTAQLDDKRNIDAAPQYITADFVKGGLIVEIHYLSLDNKGHGQNFGVRIYTDEPNWIYKSKDTQFGIYPYFYNIGLFYTIFNK